MSTRNWTCNQSMESGVLGDPTVLAPGPVEEEQGVPLETAKSLSK